MKDLLNYSQKNSFRIALLGFEESLRRTQQWLQGHVEDGILYHQKLILPEEGKRRADQEIRTALALIENLSLRFGLEDESQDAGAMMRGELAVNWANLLDARASKLRRYGPIHPELAGILDTDIQNLARIALRLASILGESGQEKP